MKIKAYAQFLRLYRRLPADPSKTSIHAYDFEFPDALVADRPAEPRDGSRLMALDRETGAIRHLIFRDLPGLLEPGDCLVLNKTKVRPARLVGRKPTGGKAELLLLSEKEPGLWTALGSGLKPGVRVELGDGERALVESGDGEWLCRFNVRDVQDLMARRGLPPLPPYILKRRKGATLPQDIERYQTVYAETEGSAAAPTAGLHFTRELLEKIRNKGVRIAELLLHVGHGTFQPVSAEDVREHRMKPEWYRIPEEALRTLEGCRRAGGRIVAVGTTATRALESFALTGRREGWTELFIRPGHEFKRVDALITNFHLPRSTPLILAGAFAGRERLLSAYQEAVSLGYRLYSYGDATLIL